jgi:hypothetical protein
MTRHARPPATQFVLGKPRPWQKRSINNAKPGTTNSARQMAALKSMSPCELACGLTVEQIDEFHRAQRERVLRRLGLTT